MKYYAGPIIWMGLIFTFSTDAGSMNNTNSFFIPMIRFLAPDVSQKDLVITLVGIRKLAHILEYAILSLLWFFALNQGRKEWSWKPVLGAIGISFVYAGIDEFHQSFVQSRTGTVADVGFDLFGAILGQGAWTLKSRGVDPLKAKFFGWWFAWGIFSTVMVLIVLRGGGLSFLQMILLILTVGISTGSGGVWYHVRQRKKIDSGA